MKIAILAFSSVPHLGGAEIFTYNLARHLAQRSHDVHLLLPFFWYRKLKGSGVPCTFRVIPICAKEQVLLDACPAAVAGGLLVLQLLMRYDVWQIIGGYPAGYCARAVAARTPAVLRSYGLDIQKEERLGYGDRLLPGRERKISEALQRMTRLVALTPTVTACYRELGIPAEKIVEIPNGVELDRFRGALERRSVRSALGIREDETLILTVGRYHKKKGYEYIPEAARQLRARGLSVRWLIVGKGLDNIQPLTGRSGLQDVILLKDQVGVSGDARRNCRLPPDELIALYRAADIFVMPSLIETFGMVLIEAMAAGLPIVTTDAPGCRDVVTHEVNGLLAAPADPASLSLHIERILCDGALRSRLSQAAARTARDYDWETVVDRYEDLYHSLAGKRS